MNFLRHLSLGLLGLLPLAAIQPPGNGIEQPSDFLSIPSGEKILRWYGIEGKNYFIQISDSQDPLRKWFWAPVIETGHNAEISYEVDGTAAKGFFRLISTDEVPGEGESLESADFDHDGLDNWTELMLSHTDPLKNDTDGDGVGDLDQYLNAGQPGGGDPDPTDPPPPNPPVGGPDADPDHDGFTNAQEQAAGTNYNDTTDFPPHLLLEQRSASMSWQELGPLYKNDPPLIDSPGELVFLSFTNDNPPNVQVNSAGPMTGEAVRSSLLGISFPFQPSSNARTSGGFPGIHIGRQSAYEYHRAEDSLGLGKVDIKSVDASHARIWEKRSASATLNGPLESYYLQMKRTSKYDGDLASETNFEEIVKFEFAKNTVLSAPVDIVPDEPSSMTEEQRYLVRMDLNTDLNNDGKIDDADAGFKSSTTEYVFYNDNLSNGAWDREDSVTPGKPENASDDDAEEILITPGISEGELWLEHPAIQGLRFYQDAGCRVEVGITASHHWTINGNAPIRVFARAEEKFLFPGGNPQVKGNLKLMLKPAGSQGIEIEGPKVQLAIVKEFGAKDYFNAARDYIMEKNTKLYVDKKVYRLAGDGGSFEASAMFTVMREEATIMRALDAYHHSPKLYAIDAVASAYSSATVIINGNMTFDKQDIGGKVLTRRCHGRLVSGGVYNAATSSDNADENTPPPNIFGQLSDLRGSELAGPEGKYIAMTENGKFTFSKGQVPLSPMPKEAMGGLSTNYSNGTTSQKMGVAPVDGGFRMLFTVSDTIETGGVLDSMVADATNSGVLPLAGGLPHELNFFKFDGGTSLALSYQSPSGRMTTPIKGSKHNGRFWDNYCIHTYIMLKSESPR